MFKNNGYALSVDNPQLTGEIEKFILVAFEDPSRVEFTWSNYPDSVW